MRGTVSKSFDSRSGSKNQIFLSVSAPHLFDLILGPLAFLVIKLNEVLSASANTAHCMKVGKQPRERAVALGGACVHLQLPEEVLTHPDQKPPDGRCRPQSQWVVY